MSGSNSESSDTQTIVQSHQQHLLTGKCEDALAEPYEFKWNQDTLSDPYLCDLNTFALPDFDFGRTLLTLPVMSLPFEEKARASWRRERKQKYGQNMFLLNTAEFLFEEASKVIWKSRKATVLVRNEIIFDAHIVSGNEERIDGALSALHDLFPHQHNLCFFPIPGRRIRPRLSMHFRN